MSNPSPSATGRSLVVVESPAKARTLQRYLGPDYMVEASVGHVKDLPKKELGIDVEHGFAPKYRIIPGKGEVVKRIKKAAKKADHILLAPDPDREGEAIAWHIAQELRKASKADIKRVLIHEITKRGVADALAAPKDLDQDKFNAQQARRILDRLVGYRMSPYLWEKVKRGLSAGRVQSVALRLICDREAEIEAFEPEEYWTIEALLDAAAPPPFTAKLHAIDGEKAKVSTGEEARRIVDELQRGDYRVARVQRRKRARRPAPPYTTSTLQQDAYQKLRFNTKRTMRIAQQLYEGLPLGEEGPVGLITYMRTDSTRISPQAIESVRRQIDSRFGSAYLPATPRTYANRKSAQDAHEAIRPTDVSRHPDMVRSYLSGEQYRLYRLIWQRFVASQMADALYDATTVDVANGRYTLRATGSVLRFDGFTKVYTAGEGAGGEAAKGKGKGRDVVLPSVAEGEVLSARALEAHQHFTQPPPRFNEASLVKELERLGIGRPSTYATILAKIQDRNYTSKEEGRFRPTPLGRAVTELLVRNFPDILDVGFTAGMEEKLDEVEEGQQDWQALIADFYENLQGALEKAKKGERVKIMAEPTDIDCPRCGAKMVIKWGSKGEFLACSTYPDCSMTADFKRRGEEIVPLFPEDVDETCESCGAPMVLRHGRYGLFLACSAYPACKTTVSAYRDEEGRLHRGLRTLDWPCPKCGGTLVVRRGRRGEFAGCTNYPTCRYAESYPPKEERRPGPTAGEKAVGRG